jgi:hypothetical protein
MTGLKQRNYNVRNGKSMESVENNSYNILDRYYANKLGEMGVRVKYHVLGTGSRYIQCFGGGNLKERET